MKEFRKLLQIKEFRVLLLFLGLFILVGLGYTVTTFIGDSLWEDLSTLSKIFNIIFGMALVVVASGMLKFLFHLSYHIFAVLDKWLKNL
jgi:hypothetical protein